jgi:lysozyme
MAIKPASRPGLSREKAQALLEVHGVDTNYPALLGVRGYFRNSMGKDGVNDVGVYDDAIFLLTPTAFAAFNANCDPSIHRYRMANLREGVWKYRVGIHGLSRPSYLRYTALVQAAEVTVIRDGAGADTGMFGINIHKGGEAGTSSLGCQTIPPVQWKEFIGVVEGSLERYERQTIPYCLISNADGSVA